MVDDLVAQHAPRVFAVAQELGEREDARIAAWGLAHEGGAHVVGVGGNTVLSSTSAEDAAVRFGLGDRLSARVVWLGTGTGPTGRVGAVDNDSPDRLLP